MGGNSASKGTSETTNKIAPELSGLTSKTAGRIGNIQDQPGFDPAEYGAPHPQKVPGLSDTMRAAVGRAYGVGEPTRGESGAYANLGYAPEYASQSALPYAGQTSYGGETSMPYASKSGRATGGTLATDPSIAAAYQAYEANVKPDIQSQFGLMGLGKSSLLGDALARGAASQLLPATQASLAREQQANEARIARETGASEAGIGRAVGANEARIARETGAAENQYGRQTQTALTSAGQYAGLGQQDINQRLAQLNALMTTGGLERGVESEQASAEQQDFLRRQGLAEQGTYGVLGQLPTSIGSQVASKTSGGSK